jgi:mono/diheme cytochrome c family protein
MIKWSPAVATSRAGRTFLACALAAALGVSMSAQSGGWTIPEGAKDEKSPVKPTADVLNKGKSVFAANCQKCHGPTGLGNGPDADPKAKPANLTQSNADVNPDGVLYYKIWNGHTKAMPAFKSKLTKPDVWAVVEYVKSLRKTS